MNNPLVQKAQYYLNESHRLNEELQAEEAYSELLENVLFELLGEEDFTKLFEYVMKGDLTHDEKGQPKSSGRSERHRVAMAQQRAKRIGDIINIGQKTRDETTRARAARALVAKNVRYAGVKDPNNRTLRQPEESPADAHHSNVGKITAALGTKHHRNPSFRDQEPTFEVKPTPANPGVGDRTPEQADDDQKKLSKVAREQRAAAKAKYGW